MSWAEVQKINEKIDGLDMNMLMPSIYLADYKAHGDKSYVKKGNEFYNKILGCYNLSINDPTISTEDIYNYAIKNNEEDKFLYAAFGEEGKKYKLGKTITTIQGPTTLMQPMILVDVTCSANSGGVIYVGNVFVRSGAYYYNGNNKITIAAPAASTQSSSGSAYSEIKKTIWLPVTGLELVNGNYNNAIIAKSTARAILCEKISD